MDVRWLAASAQGLHPPGTWLVSSRYSGWISGDQDPSRSLPWTP